MLPLPSVDGKISAEEVEKCMSKHLGSEKLGSFYTGKKARKRREWRGLKDTWYSYTQWLGLWKTLITFMMNRHYDKAAEKRQRRKAKDEAVR